MADGPPSLPVPPSPSGSYVPAVAHRGRVFVSAQAPRSDGGLVATGRLESTGLDAVLRCAEVSVTNAVAQAANLLGGAQQIGSVLSFRTYVVAESTIGDVTGPIEETSRTAFARILSTTDVPIGTVVAVTALPNLAPLVTEAIFEVRPNHDDGRNNDGANS